MAANLGNNEQYKHVVISSDLSEETLQQHFGDRYRSAEYVDPGYTSGNEVWRVELEAEVVYLKKLRAELQRGGLLEWSEELVRN